MQNPTKNWQILVMVMAEGRMRGGEVLVLGSSVLVCRVHLSHTAHQRKCAAQPRAHQDLCFISALTLTQPGVCHKFLSQFSLNVLCCVLACGGRAVCGEVW